VWGDREKATGGAVGHPNAARRVDMEDAVGGGIQENRDEVGAFLPGGDRWKG
jgi:hypothetical protein